MSIFAINSIQQSQFVAINVFDYAADGTLEGATAIVTANRSATFQTDDPVAVNLSYIQIVHENLLTQGDFLVSNAETDERFTEEDRAWLQSRNLHSLYCLPLHIQNTLYGFITIIDTTNSLAPTPLEKQIFQNIAQQAAAIIEKRRLLQQTQEQTRVLSLLNGLIQRANVEQDEIKLLQDMVQVLYEATEFDHVGIGLLAADNAISHIVAEYPDTGSVGVEVEAGANSIAEILRQSGQSLIIPDVVQDTTLPPLSRQVLTELKVQSVIFLPMFDLNGKLLATIGLDRYEKVASFLPQTIESTEAMVSQIAVNLQKLRLLRHSQAQAAQLQQIAEFGQAMQASLQLEEILSTVLEYSRNIITADYVAVMIYDRNIENFRMSAQFWEDGGQVTLPGIAVAKESDTIAAQAWEKRHLIHVEALQSGWDWEHPWVATLRSLMVAPLIAGGVLLGVLEVGSLHDGAYSTTDVAAFRQMTNQLAVAIANAETYSQSQRLALNKVKANEIIAMLQQQTDVTAILQVTAQELGKALGAKRARIRLGLNVPKPSGD
ncbi:MAG: GAF domain-containing protein [Anaerolineae bacterium]|nr:GAF domain-containing protein [Anaerolineae bacterium]